MSEKYKEVVLPGRVEVVYTVLTQYKRYDGVMIAKCRKVANNISPRGIVENDCGVDDIAVSALQGFERIN